MLFLASFFPMGDIEQEETEHKFDLVQDFLRATVDLADLVGIYLVMQRVSGKGQVKVLVAGLGWAFAELVLTGRRSTISSRVVTLDVVRIRSTSCLRR